MKGIIEYFKNYGKKVVPSRTQCLFRMIAGGYLLYLGISMIKEFKNMGNSRLWYLIPIIVFIGFGGLYLFLNARIYLKQEYSDGPGYFVKDDGTTTVDADAVETEDAEANDDEAKSTDESADSTDSAESNNKTESAETDSKADSAEANDDNTEG